MNSANSVDNSPSSLTLTVLAQTEGESGRISIRISEDKLAIYLFVTKGTGDKEISLSQVKRLIEEKKIVTELDEKGIESVLGGLEAAGDEISEVLITQGEAPIAGKDGEAILDYNVSNPVVSTGDSLFKIAEPTSGRPGTDVFGEAIEVRPGKPLKVMMADGVRSNEEGTQFWAEVDGHVAFTGHRVCVSSEFSVKVQDGDTKVSISFILQEVTGAKIVNFLADIGIVKGIDQGAVERAAAAGKASNVVVAQTTMSVPGKEASLKYNFSQPDAKALVQDASGRIDYKNQNTLDMVDQGHVLARLVPAIIGEAGMDVYGIVKEIPTIKDIKLRAGENVIVEEKDGTQIFHAEIRGMPVLEAGELSITNIYLVDGDLDLSVGNIEFDGTVSIRGSLLDGFSVKSGEDIVIGGTVGAVDLTAKGSVKVTSGFKGKEKGRVVCGDSLSAKYLDDNFAEVENDVIIEREIVGTELYCRGNVSCSGGVLVGGETYALSGVTVGTLGSSAYIRTVVIVGEDYKLLRYREEWDTKLKKMSEEEEDIGGKLSQIKRNPQVLKRMSPELKLKFKQMLVRLKEIDQIRAEVGKEMTQMQSYAMDKRVGEIVVQKMLYPGTYVKIGFSEQEIKAELKGPLKIIEDVENQRISFVEV